MLCDVKMLRVSDKLGVGWFDLGIYLKIDNAHLKAIEHDERGQKQMAFRMLTEWRDQSVCDDIEKVKTLTNALTEAGKYNIVAEEFKISEQAKSKVCVVQ